MKYLRHDIAQTWLAIALSLVVYIGSYSHASAQQLTQSGLDAGRFVTTIDGKQTGLFTLTNNNGMEACITNYGARLVSLMTPNWTGRMEDVVLGYDNIGDYIVQGQNFGATMGRYVGRISGPAFTIDGKIFPLQDNGKGYISHGGNPGFQNRVWDVVEQGPQKLVLRYVSPDGENGFPGELTVLLTYTLTDQNSLDVDFNAITTKPTVINFTNHSFFNISGEPNRDILSHHLWIDSKRYAEYDKNKNVTGKWRKVKRTPFNFKKPREIGERIDRDNEQLAITKGYDHTFLLRHPANMRKPAAILYEPRSGRTLTVYTTEPAIHIYTANGLKGDQRGKGGILYGKRSAVCLETMHPSDSPNKPQFPSTLLRPGENYHSKTVFKFSTEPKILMKK
ncbi:MAG: galactose mutarotase [Prevotella sp.]|nr:galactose mutarotase [Prevotella sp.]